MHTNREKYNSTDLVPAISNNVLPYLVTEFSRGEYDLIVEFGSGHSTQYFLRQLSTLPYQTQFVSVEYNQEYFSLNVSAIREAFSALPGFEERLAVIPWSDDKMRRYWEFSGLKGKDWEYPESVRRFPRSQEDFRRTIGVDPLIQNFPSYLFSANRLSDASYYARITSSLSFAYFLRSDFCLDQYGESPVKADYIDAGVFWPVIQRLKQSDNELHAAFLIDGGPRHDILNSILDAENEFPHFIPTVYLLEANRIHYDSAIGRRSTGHFIKGSNYMIDGNQMNPDIPSDPLTVPLDSLVMHGKPGVTGLDLGEKEIWQYKGYRRGLSTSPDLSEQLDKAVYLFKSRNFSAALEILKVIESRDQNNYQVKLMTAMCLLETEAKAEGKVLLASLKRQFPHDRYIRTYEVKLDEAEGPADSTAPVGGIEVATPLLRQPSV